MSRSNPQEDYTPNPATRWFEWNGELGNIRYWDKDAKKTVEVALPFRFIVLDRLGSVTGWHELSESRIWSNEVKDTREGVLVVKAHKEGLIAQGLYKDIKDKVASAGGQFTINCYIAYKNGGGALSIGSIKFKGAALRAWMDFEKAHRADLYKQAVEIEAFSEGKKGRVIFRMPTLKIAPLSAESNAAATKLDTELQEWLVGYLARNTRDRVEQSAPPSQHPTSTPPHPADSGAPPADGESGYYDHGYDDVPDNTPIVDEDSIPF